MAECRRPTSPRRPQDEEHPGEVRTALRGTTRRAPRRTPHCRPAGARPAPARTVWMTAATTVTRSPSPGRAAQAHFSGTAVGAVKRSGQSAARRPYEDQQVRRPARPTVNRRARASPRPARTGWHGGELGGRGGRARRVGGVVAPEAQGEKDRGEQQGRCRGEPHQPLTVEHHGSSARDSEARKSAPRPVVVPPALVSIGRSRRPSAFAIRTDRRDVGRTPARRKPGRPDSAPPSELAPRFDPASDPALIPPAG